LVAGPSRIDADRADARHLEQAMGTLAFLDTSFECDAARTWYSQSRHVILAGEHNWRRRWARR